MQELPENVFHFLTGFQYKIRLQSNLSLLYATSKVAPLKTISIYRLELWAGLLLTRLSDKIIKSIIYGPDPLWVGSKQSRIYLKLSLHIECQKFKTLFKLKHATKINASVKKQALVLFAIFR